MRNKDSKKNKFGSKIRHKVLRKQSLGVVVPGIAFIAYPLSPWLIELGGGDIGMAANCEPFPLTPLVIFIGLLYCSIITTFLFFLFNWIKSAICFLLNGIFTAGFFVGSWWLLIGHFTVLCKEPPLSNSIVFINLLGLLLITVLVFIFYQRNAMKKVLEINPHVFNFETMQYTYLAPLLRPDGKDNNQMGMLMISGGFLGLLLVKLPIAEWLGFAPLSQEWIIYGISLFLGYAFMGYLGIGQLYLIWLIHKKCKAAGRTMMVKELL